MTHSHGSVCRTIRLARLICRTLTLIAAAACLAPAAASAQTVIGNVNNEATLRAAIFQVSNDFARGVNNGPYTIEITGNIILTRSLPMIRGVVPANGSTQITIRSSNFRIIDGDNVGRIFFVESGRVLIEGLILTDGLAQGGHGGRTVSPMFGGGGGVASALAARCSWTMARR